MDQLDQVVHFYRKLLCLVNGSSSSFIQSSKGSKQGEPLSSYLFMIVMEAHSFFFLIDNQSNILEKAKKAACIQGVY